jgi:hypothetical protein
VASTSPHRYTFDVTIWEDLGILPPPAGDPSDIEVVMLVLGSREKGLPPVDLTLSDAESIAGQEAYVREHRPASVATEAKRKSGARPGLAASRSSPGPSAD